MAEIDGDLDCRHRVTKLREGSEIQFQIKARNAAGTGEPSTPTDYVVIKQPSTVPGLLQ